MDPQLREKGKGGGGGGGSLLEYLSPCLRNESIVMMVSPAKYEYDHFEYVCLR